jgi:Protein of unknown function (DUF4245)
MGIVSEARSGYRRSAGGLVGAILVCLALIAVMWLLTRFQGAGGEDADPAPTVEYADAFEQARAQADFDVLAPRQAPPGWRATSVEWEQAGPIQTWRLGFVTPSEEFVGVEQSNDASGDVVEAATPADQPGAPVIIAGETWQTLTAADGETAFVLAGDDVTTVVTGTAPEDELVTFVESLSTR